MTGDGSWSVSFAVSPSQTTAAMSGGSSRADTKQALRQGRMWSDQVKRSPGFSPIFELDGQSASPLIASRPTKHSWSATKLQATRTEHTHLPWASLSLSLPSLHKQKPAAQQHAHTPNISFQASPAHVLPACSDHVASSPSVTPPNKRRCIPWHQAEFSMPIKPQKQPMLASITASSDLRRSKRRQPSLLSTQHTAMQSRASDSCISRRHQHSPILCLASAASRAVDEEAEEVLLTRTKDLSLRVKDRLKTLSKRMPNQMRRLVAGAVAGALSKTAIAPIETIRMQVMGGKGGVMELIARTWARKGVLGFFSGNSADILRVMPSKAIELSAFDAYKKFLSHHDERGELKRPGPLLTGLAGAAAGMTSTLALYPLETLRTRLALGDYDNMLHAIRAVAAEEGPMAFYQGISASLIGILPYAAIRLGVYDGLKWSHKKFGKDKHIPALNTALYGAFAGLVSATATFPVEVVRRRMMVGTVKGSTWAALTTIAKKEGWKSLYKGIGLTWAKQAPQYAVTFLAYDLIKEYLEV